MMNETMFHASLMNPTETILEELQFEETTQKSIALTYYLAMTSDERTDWGKVNSAIIEKWSSAGLRRVKEMAHAHFKPAPAQQEAPKP